MPILVCLFLLLFLCPYADCPDNPMAESWYLVSRDDDADVNHNVWLFYYIEHCNMNTSILHAFADKIPVRRLDTRLKSYTSLQFDFMFMSQREG